MPCSGLHSAPWVFISTIVFSWVVFYIALGVSMQDMIRLLNWKEILGNRFIIGSIFSLGDWMEN